MTILAAARESASAPRWLTFRNVTFLLLSALVTFFVFYYLFSIISWAEVVNLWANASLLGVLLFLVFSISQSVARTWQYRVLLTVNDTAVPRLPLFLIVIVRNFFSDLLPARLGQLIYIYLVNNRLGIPLALAMASFALAFIFDVIAVVPLILAAVALVSSDVLPFRGALTVAAVLFAAVSSTLILLLPRMFGTAERIVERMFGQGRIKLLLLDFLETTKISIEKTRAAGVYGQVFVLSVLVRFLKYTALYFFLYALLAPRGYTFETLSAAKSFIGLCAAEFAASLPISGLGGFGLYEGTWAFTFRLLGFPQEIAVLTSVAHHLFTQIYAYALAACALLLLLLPIWRAQKSKPRIDSTPLFIGKVLLFGVGCSLSALLVFWMFSDRL